MLVYHVRYLYLLANHKVKEKPRKLESPLCSKREHRLSQNRPGGEVTGSCVVLQGESAASRAAGKRRCSHALRLALGLYFLDELGQYFRVFFQIAACGIGSLPDLLAIVR